MTGVLGGRVFSECVNDSCYPAPRAADLRVGGALAIVVALVSRAGASTGDAAASAGGKRVLFVGNSLTYVNDLPRTLADLARAVDDTPLVYRTIAKPDYSLEDHWYDGIASGDRRATTGTSS